MPLCIPLPCNRSLWQWWRILTVGFWYKSSVLISFLVFLASSPICCEKRHSDLCEKTGHGKQCEQWTDVLFVFFDLFPLFSLLFNEISLSTFSPNDSFYLSALQPGHLARFVIIIEVLGKSRITRNITHTKDSIFEQTLNREYYTVTVRSRVWSSFILSHFPFSLLFYVAHLMRLGNQPGGSEVCSCVLSHSSFSAHYIPLFFFPSLLLRCIVSLALAVF